MMSKDNSIKTLLIIPLIVFLLSACSVQRSGSPGSLDAFTEQIRQAAPGLLHKYRVPGAAVALVHNGEVAWVQGYGLADEKKGTPVAADTVFQVASISKSVTGWGIMQLVETGKIGLDEPVDQYLNSWHLPPSEFDQEEVTVRRLLSHTAGLAAWDYPGVPVDEAQPSPVELLSGVGARQEVHVDWQPGLREKYTNGDYLLLQLLVEDVTGEEFSDYIQRQILAPLKMNHSSYQWLPGLRPWMAAGYQVSGKPVEPRWYPEAAGGLYATVADLASWLAAGMPGSQDEPAGRGVLQPQTLELMYAPVPADEGSSSGLGYTIEILPDGTRMVWHSGDISGWRGQFAALPDLGEGIVVLTNSNTGRYVIADLICGWANWLVGVAPNACQIYQTIYLIIPTIASLIGLGIAIAIWRFAAQIRSGGRRLSWPPGTDQQRRDIFLPFVAIVLWWVIVAPRVGSLLPRRFDWISLAFTFWCLVSALKGLTVKSADPLLQA